MVKQLTRTFVTAAALLSLFATSSAFGAHGTPPARTLAALHASHPRKAARRRTRHKPRAAVHRARHRRGTAYRVRHKPGTVVHSARSHQPDVWSTNVLLGDREVESQSDSLAAGQAEAFRLHASASGLARLVHLYISSANTAGTVIVGLYSDAYGHPDSLLSAGSASASSAGTWSAVSIAQIELMSGRTYWLAILGRGGVLRYRDRWRGSCPSQTSAQTTLGALPTYWRTGTFYSDCPVSAYVTADDPPPPDPIEPVAPTPPFEPVPPANPAPSEEPPPPAEEPLPPAPVAPANTVPPSIAGSAIEGQELGASSGSWSGSPSSYAYQWEDCNTSGEGCVNVSGATASSYKLASSDIGHTIRVVVTASNTGGSTPVTSASAGPVAARPPTANFIYAPVSPVTGQPVTLDGTSSTCADGPCTYEWSDDGSPTRPIPPLWPLGTGQTLSFTFSSAGTKYVRLVITDATGQAATVEHNIIVEPSESPPAAPTNTVLPLVSGPAEEGQTLTAGNGTWSGSPTSYTYRWQDCNASGEGCSDVTGATASSYKLASSDVGHTLRLVVTASNVGGSASATSAATPVVVADQPPKPPSNLTLPGIGGAVQVGQTLSASNGTWTGSPTSYAYQWEDCDSSGEACSSIGGATTAAHTLTHGEVGKTVRVVVTASNGSGAAEAESPASGIVEGEGGPSCTKEVEPGLGAATIAQDIETLANGQTLCFASGKYREIIEVNKGSAERTAYATLRPAAGAKPELYYLILNEASYLQVKKLKFEGELAAVKKGTEEGKEQQGGVVEMFGAENIELLEDTWENMSTGVDMREHTPASKKITLENDYMYHAEFGEVKNEASGENAPFGCNTGLARGEDVVMNNSEEVNIKHSTFFLTDGHYTQGGSKVAMEHDLFEGYVPYECQHVNVWQVFTGGEDLTFSNNIVFGKGHGGGVGPHGTGSELAAAADLEFQNGGNSSDCSVKMMSLMMENNVFVNGGSQAFQTQGTEGQTVKHNTVAGTGLYAYSLGGYACTPTNLTVEQNIGVESVAGSTNFSVNGAGAGFKCNKNVSDDETANGVQGCGSEYKRKWKPEWEETSWNPIEETERGNHFPKPPQGWYVPKSGSLAFASGYEGGAGP